MSGTPDDGNGNDVSLAYTDGNMNYQLTSSTRTWSSTTYEDVPQPQPAPMLPSPQMVSYHQVQQLPAMNFAQQHHQQAMAHHNAVFQQHHSMMQNAFRPVQPALLAVQTQIVQQQPAIQYVQSVGQAQLMPPQTQSSYSGAQVATLPQGRELNQYAQDDEDQRQLELEKGLQEGLLRQREMDKHVREGMKRVRRLEEERDARSQQERRDKEREIEALKQELARSKIESDRIAQQQAATQQRILQQQQQHHKDVAEMMKANAAKSERDKADMVKMMTDLKVQNDRTRNDRDRTIEQFKTMLNEQFAGVARSSDVDKAASHLDKRLAKLPAGASRSEIQGAFSKELDDFWQKKAAERQQQRLEAPAAPAAVPRQQQEPSRYRTEFEVQELTQDTKEPSIAHIQPAQPRQQAATRVSHSAQPTSKSHVASIKPSVVDQTVQPVSLPATALTAGALARVPALPASKEAKSSKTSKSRVPKGSVAPTSDNALARIQRSEVLTKIPEEVADIPQPAVIPQRALAAPTISVPQATPMPQTGMALTEGALAKIVGTGADSSKSHKTKVAKASVLPTSDNALARIKTAESKPTHSAKRWVQPSASNAMVRSSGGESPQYKSSAEAIAAISQFAGGQLVAYGQERSTSLAVAADSTVARIQPKNDRRAESGMRQLTYPDLVLEPESQALVRQSTEVSKKSRR